MNIQILDVYNPIWLEILEKLDGDFYHLPEYLSIEGKRINAIPEAFLAVDRDKIFFVPYLLRKCDESILPSTIAEEIFDVVSPYGYPGFLYNREATSDPNFLRSVTNELISSFLSKHICSAFFRLHPILNRDVLDIFPENTFNFSNKGETIAVDLSLSAEQIWSNTRDSHRTKINRCKRQGMVAKIVDTRQSLPEFMAIYQETMNRVAAKDTYYFDVEYYLNLFDLEDRVHLCLVELDGQAICGSLLFEYGGIVQYHLGGTRNEFLKLAPTTLMFDFIRLWAKERGNLYFHLGGGLGGVNDSLHHFKAGFSKQKYPFFTLRSIVNSENYDKLVARRAKILDIPTETLLESDFFPAYRYG
jgi:Acetyltransferase (GNAT) domain